MSLGGLTFALTAVDAVSRISQGYAQKAEAKANASILQGEAGLIDIQSDIEQGQYQRAKGKYLSQSVASLAKSGIMPQGSAMAVILDAQTQIGIDQAISKFNYTIEKNYKLSEAAAEKRRGKYAFRSGMTGAFSSLLQGYSNYKMYKGGFDMGGGGYSQYGNKYGSNTPKGVIDTGSYSKLFYKG